MTQREAVQISMGDRLVFGSLALMGVIVVGLAALGMATVAAAVLWALFTTPW